MPLKVMAEAVNMIRTQAGTQIEIEATGGIEVSGRRLIAEKGGDLPSIGAPTPSAPGLGFSMLFPGAWNLRT